LDEDHVSTFNPGSINNEPIHKAVRVTFDSEGSSLEGWYFPARGVGPAPTAILLHGFPVEGQSPLGLGGALMRTGINALSFYYRGTGGSQGLYLASTAVADVSSALTFLNSTAEFSQPTDLTRISLVGYSFGGGVALISALSNPAIQKVATIAGANLCEIARQCVQNKDYRKSFLKGLQKDISDSGTNSPGAEACEADLQERLLEYDPVINMDKLIDRDILMVAGSRDTSATLEDHILPIYSSLQRGGSKKASLEIYDCGHNFIDFRETLAQRVVDWIRME
jgi:pimeloyl-ACP methyl ester carboxylesterase